MYNPFETVVGFLHQGSLELSPFTMEKILDRHRTLGTRMASESRKVICCLIHVLHDIVFYITVLRKSIRVSVIQKSTVYTSSKLLHYKLIMTLFFTLIAHSGLLWFFHWIHRKENKMNSDKLIFWTLERLMFWPCMGCYQMFVN